VRVGKRDESGWARVVYSSSYTKKEIKRKQTKKESAVSGRRGRSTDAHIPFFIDFSCLY